MSGIAAIYYFGGRRANREDIERVGKSLRMYGPERQTARLDGPVALAYAHFTDTPESRNGSQPLLGGDGRFVMVFDGRLDNRNDLARELNLDRQRLPLLSDGQLAMLCWERWADSALNRWVGEFAFINWDRNEQILTAARDQLGGRTLHYNATSTRLIITSAPKCIHALGDIPREVDEQKIADALSQLYHDGERTFFRGITRIAPASMMTVSGEAIKTHKYYNFREHVRPIQYANDRDYVDAAHELFETSVQAMLRSVKPVGAFMSGGLDSSTMSVYAARSLERQGKRLITFTSVPEAGWDKRIVKGAFGDEGPHVKAIAEYHPSIEVNLIDGEGLGHYHKQEELLLALEMPVRNALNLQWTHAILEKSRDRGIGVMLQGVFGNATLSHNGDGVFAYLLQQGKLAQLCKELSIISASQKRFIRNVLKYIVYPLGPNWLWNLKERLRGHPRAEINWGRLVTADPTFAKKMNIPERIDQAGYRFFGGKPQLGRQAWFNMVENYMTETGDILQGLRAIYGIDIRDPFADRRLVEWSFGVPENQYHRNGEDRWLIRRMMEGSLPDIVLNDKKVGRQTADWHSRMTRDLPRMQKDLEHMAEDADLSRMVDIPKLRGLLDDWPEHTITDLKDDRYFQLPVNIPMTYQVARFVQRVKGVNLPD